jgi:hypothetical protein
MRHPFSDDDLDPFERRLKDVQGIPYDYSARGIGAVGDVFGEVNKRPNPKVGFDHAQTSSRRASIGGSCRAKKSLAPNAPFEAV